MRIGLLGAANSIHIVRIANELLKQGHYVIVCSLPNHKDQERLLKCNTIYLKYSGSKGYYLNHNQVKQIFMKENLDILNAHYASGYGTLGRLSGVAPWVLSIWGSDIFSFPRKNIINKYIVQKNLCAANLLFSTSYCMKEEIQKYVSDNKNILITPFGVDLDKFTPKKKNNKPENLITVGFFKGTNKIYGIDLFLVIVDELKTRLKNTKFDLKVIICGGGNRIDFIKSKIDSMELNDVVEYLGQISHDRMPQVIQSCDIGCIPSHEESFGVVAVEAMACGVPCVTSCAPGLNEVMLDNNTGYIVETNNFMDYANKIYDLIVSREKRKKFSLNGRKHVESEYNFKKNIEVFIEGYYSML